jgi:aspartate oxidase
MTGRARIEIVAADVTDVFPTAPSVQPHFVRLVAANGRTLGNSEVYANRANAKRARGDWLAALAGLILADPAAFFEGHPEVLTAAHAHAERSHSPLRGATRGHGAYDGEDS